MISKKTIAAALIAGSTLAAIPATANAVTVEFGFGGPGYGYGWTDHRDRGDRGGWHHRRHDRLSTDQVRWMLRDHGYRNIRFLDDRGRTYEVRARKRGETYFLVISARSGEIIARHRT